MPERIDTTQNAANAANAAHAARAVGAAVDAAAASRVTHDELTALLASGTLADDCGRFVELVGPTDLTPRDLGAEPCVVLGVDVVAHDDTERSDIATTVGSTPIAAASACMLLRTHDRGQPVEARLAHESAVYSTLQAGPEFARWRAARPVRGPAPATAATAAGEVRVERHDDVVRVTLHRPTRGNAVNRTLRDALVEALLVPVVDPSISTVILCGAGPNFCTGGDLDEFATFDDPASAHLVRQQRSIARTIVRVADRMCAELHGRCEGSGIELPAFARTVAADPGATFRLPELQLGLVPGAGGTVSVCDRIGAQRTAWLLLTGRRIDATTALEWGLIDVITPIEPADDRTEH